MEIQCCYRLIPDGEVIHTLYNTETGEVYGLPDNYLDAKHLDFSEYSTVDYIGKTTDYEAMCEAVLLASRDHAFCVETAGMGYHVLQWNGFWKLLYSPMDEEDNGEFLDRPQQGNYTYIGYRMTKLKQYRSCQGIYRLTLELPTGKIITNDGILTPEFDVRSLDKIDFHYTGYKDMVEAGAYAVVYQSGSPVFLDRTIDNKLVMRPR
jgi:hypothetical protein